MLNAKKYALTKIEYLLVSNEFANELFVTKPLQVCFRDHMGYLARSLKANPSAEKALLLCQLHGLVVGSVAEANEPRETPLKTAIADGVTGDKLELLLEAGSDVTFTMDCTGGVYQGVARYYRPHCSDGRRGAYLS
jgi:hypothetical protein